MDNINMMSDFPKIECPFVRKIFQINRDHWKKKGKGSLRKPEVYLVVNKVNPGFEWVFEDPDTFAVEKLDGTNVKLNTENGRLIAVQNRLNVIDPLQIIKGKTYIIEGIFTSIGKGFVKENGVQAGEVIGPKLQENLYKLNLHEWYPFEKAISNLRYKSFDEHERNFENWSAWFKDWLFSRYFTKRASTLGLDDKVMAEGVVFYNIKRREERKSWMAKLRRDMFDWYYSDKIEIINYNSDAI